MKFAPLIAKIAKATDEAALRSHFMDDAGSLVGATAWGIDLLDSRCQVIASEMRGLPEAFVDRYQALDRAADPVSQYMIQQQIPVHNLSIQSPQEWHQSQLYQAVFQAFELEHGMIAPLVGDGRLIGGIYFLRDATQPSFDNRDLTQVSTLCQYLSAGLAVLRLKIDPLLIDCLTPREIEIAQLVAQGLSNRVIASRLQVSQDAIKQSLKRMFQKLDVSARAAMIAKLKV